MVLQRMLEESVPSLLSPPHRGLMVCSAIVWGAGDVGAQAITHYSVSGLRALESEDKDEKFKIDWYRVYVTSCFGLGACIGPAAYYRFIKSLQSSLYGTPQLVASMAFDGVLATLNLASFFPFMGFRHGKNWSVQQVKEDLKRGFTPALVLGGAMVPAKLLMSLRFIPAPYQLHCASLFGLLLVGSCSLSWIQQRRDAADS